jgi:long-chain acyl-CoA synthetase
MLKSFVGVGSLFWTCKLLMQGLIPRFHRPFFLFAPLERLLGLIGCLLLLIPDQLGNLLVFRKIRNKTGGCLKLPISGGGALPAHVDRFFAAVKIDIFEGYGLTETSPVIAVRTLDSRMPFTVGRPIPNVEVRICGEDGQPLANQHHKGIVYCRGDLVMKGYYKDPDKTAAVISKDGWFNTGDLGRLTVTGQLQLRGRAKDTIVLTGGENIEPEPIEALLIESPMIHQCMVYGQDKKRLSVMIVPDQDTLVEWAAAQKIPYTDMNELCNTDRVLDEYKRIVDSKVSTQNGFKSFEKIFCILLLPDSFKVGEEMTHSLKLKRNVIAEKYKNKIEIKCYTSFGD